MAKNLVNSMRIEDLGMAILPLDPIAELDPKASDRINQAEIVNETKRLLLSVQPLLNSRALDDIHGNCFITSNYAFPGILGDCPIIEKENTDFRMLGDFIFPLSSTATLVRKRGAQRYISNPLFYIQKDLMIFDLSEKYVACRNRAHLEHVALTYEKLNRESKIHLLQKYIFEFIS